MKVNSEKLWDYIFNLATDEKVRFKVYCDDIYFAEILWNGEEFEWESGTFTSRAFFNPMYDFVPIEEEKEIEKLKIEQDTPNNYYIKNEYGTKCALTKHSKMIAEKVNELIDEVKKLKEDK